MRNVIIMAMLLALAGCGSAVENAGKAVLAKLDNPASARFNNVRSTPEGNVCGQVKVKDGNGVYGGYMAYVALRHGDSYEAVIDQDGSNATVRAACITAQDQALAEASGAAAHAGTWEVRIASGDNMGNITDMASRLVEGGFMANFVQKDGVTQVYLGPFTSKEEAEQKRTALMASKGIDSLVLPFEAGK